MSSCIHECVVSRCLFDIKSLRSSHIALLHRLIINALMCCCLHLKSARSHVYTSIELHRGHVCDG